MSRSRENYTNTRRLVRATLLAIIALVISLILSGAIQIFYIQKATDAYSRIVSHEIPALTELQALTTSNANYHRFLLSSILTESEVERADSVRRIQEAALSYEKQIDHLKELLPQEDASDKLEQLIQSREVYEQDSQKLIEILKSGDRQAALEFRVKVLRPKFERSQQIETEIGELLKNAAISAHEESDKEMRRAQYILTILTVWPILATALILVVLLSFGIWIWFKLPKDEDIESRP